MSKEPRSGPLRFRDGPTGRYISCGDAAMFATSLRRWLFQHPGDVWTQAVLSYLVATLTDVEGDTIQARVIRGADE